jgi:hypothetical protein
MGIHRAGKDQGFAEQADMEPLATAAFDVNGRARCRCCPARCPPGFLQADGPHYERPLKHRDVIHRRVCWLAGVSDYSHSIVDGGFELTS